MMSKRLVSLSLPQIVSFSVFPLLAENDQNHAAENYAPELIHLLLLETNER